METRRQKDTPIIVQTPEGIEFSLYPAGILIRACSYLIDIILQGLLSLAAIIIFVNSFAEIFGVWIFLLYAFLLNWFYHVICELCFKGQSLGKKIMGIRVVRSNGSPVNPGASFVRNLLRFADTFMGFFIIALSSIMVSPGFRRIGDLAADTLVVYTINSLSPTKKTSMSWLSQYEKIIPSRKLSLKEKQTIILFAKRFPILGKARAEETARKYVEDLYGQILPVDFSCVAYLLGIARTINGDDV